MNHFFNTINASQQELPLFEAKAEKQEALVLSIFQEKKGHWMTPPYVHAIVKAKTGKDVPLTSVRRAISVLTKGDKDKGIEPTLIKSGLAVSKGLYGVPNHAWTLII